MEFESDFRHWDDLIPDALGLIFSNLSLQEVLTVIPRVCKSWSKAVAGPYCWQEIDIEEWSSRQPEHLDRMLRMLITRSSGSLRKLSVSGLQNDMIFSFIAENAGSLQALRLRRCNMSDSIVEQTAGRFSAITFLDLSYCTKIGARALEAMGKNCKQLVSLKRNMHPQDTAGKHSIDDEANAIAATMPGLKYLEMAYHLIDTTSVLKILSSCPQLEFFDLRGCWSVKLDEQFLKEKNPKLKVLGPEVKDYYEMYEWDDCSDDDSDSSYLAFEFLAAEMGDYDAYEIYDGMWDGTDAGFYGGWPPSP